MIYPVEFGKGFGMQRQVPNGVGIQHQVKRSGTRSVVSPKTNPEKGWQEKAEVVILLININSHLIP